MTSPNPLQVVAGYVRRFLALEPAVIGGFVRAVIYLAATLGWVIPQGIEGRAVEIFTALVVVVELAVGIYTRTRVTPTAKVVEQLSTDGVTIVAGPANEEIPAGSVIRATGMTRREYRAQHPID